MTYNENIERLKQASNYNTSLANRYETEHANQVGSQGIRDAQNIASGLKEFSSTLKEWQEKQKEKALDGLPAEHTIEDVREAVKIQVEQRVIPEAGIPTIEDDGGRQEWLDRTANSPAANAGFSDDERWALQQKHRAWKKGRKKRK